MERPIGYMEMLSGYDYSVEPRFNRLWRLACAGQHAIGVLASEWQLLLALHALAAAADGLRLVWLLCGVLDLRPQDLSVTQIQTQIQTQTQTTSLGPAARAFLLAPVQQRVHALVLHARSVR